THDRPNTSRSKRQDVSLLLRWYRLEASIGLPAPLAALLRVTATPTTLPVGRGELLQRGIEATLQQRVSHTPHAPDLPHATTTLSLLAGHLRGAGTRYVRIAEDETPEQALARFLAQDTLPRPDPPQIETGPPIVKSKAGATSEAQEVDEPKEISAGSATLGTQTIGATETGAPDATSKSAATDDAGTTSDDITTRVCQEALRAGILTYSVDGRHIGFAHGVLEAAFAARWLGATNGGLGSLRPELLRPTWHLPLLLWAGTLPQPGDLAKRLLRLVDTPENTALRAGLATPTETVPVALALALALLAEST